MERTTTQIVHERYAQIVDDLKLAEQTLYDLFKRLGTTQDELRRHGVEALIRFNAPMEACFDEWARLNGDQATPRSDADSELQKILGRIHS